MDLFNSVRNKVDLLRGTELEKKVKEATSNEKWGASSTLKKEIAEATFSYEGYKEVMPMVWQRLGESNVNWRIVYKSLDLIDFLLRHGSERVIREVRDRIFQIRTLNDFTYVDEESIDRGSGVREKSKKVAELANDSDRLKEARDIARKNVAKFSGHSNAERNWGGSQGAFGDQYDRDDRFGASPKAGSSRGTSQRRPSWTDEERVRDSSSKSKKKKKDKKKETSSDDESESDSDDKKKKKKKKKDKEKKEKKGDEDKKKKKTKTKVDIKPAPIDKPSRKKSQPAPVADDDMFGEFNDDPFQSAPAAPAAPSDDENPFGDDDPFDPRAGDHDDHDFGDFESAAGSHVHRQQHPHVEQHQRQPQQPPAQQKDFFDVFDAPVGGTAVPVDHFITEKPAPVVAPSVKQATAAPSAPESKAAKGDALWGDLVDLGNLSVSDNSAAKNKQAGASRPSPALPDLGPIRSSAPPPSLPMGGMGMGMGGSLSLARSRSKEMATVGGTQGRLVVLAMLVVALGVYLATDPLGQGAMVGFPDFETYAVDAPHWSELPPERDESDRLQSSDVRWIGQVQGPESIAFDPAGRGPYTGVADGRILFWNGSSWLPFAHASPYRSEICNYKSSLLSYLKDEHICGRPLGLRFYKKTGELFFADAYFGLAKVGPEGGLATSLATSAEGVPIGFPNDLDIDDEGNVYFTDSSANYKRRNFLQLIFTSEPTGRLLKYDAATKETTVLVRNLQFPNGVTLSKDGSFLIFCVGSRARLMRYWLKGENAGKTEPFAILPGFPDNVRTNPNGEFWVAIHARQSTYAYFCASRPRFRKYLLKLPIPAKYHYFLSIGGGLHAQIIKYGPDGQVLQVLEDRQGKVVRAVSEVEEKDGELWIGSVIMQFIAVYKL